MAAFRHFSESTELDLSFNELTEVRAGMWEVSDKVAISGSTVMYFLLLTCTSYLIN